jgi:multicomponent K+:H+ antiporter subunit D
MNVTIWTVILCSSLIAIVGLARAGSVVFWKANSVTPQDDAPELDAPSPLAYVAVGGLLALLVTHAALGGYAQAYFRATAEQLFAPEPYISTVVDTAGKLSSPTSEDH